MSRNAQALAAAAAAAMYSDDRCSKALGMELLEVRPGYARMRMAVRKEMTNGHNIGHGGMTFSLADSTFAFACNSHNKPAVAVNCMIDFISQVQLGDVLTATAVEQSLAGRYGVYDVRIDNQHGEAVALFRGKSMQLKGAWVDTAPKAN